MSNVIIFIRAGKTDSPFFFLWLGGMGMMGMQQPQMGGNMSMQPQMNNMGIGMQGIGVVFDL